MPDNNLLEHARQLYKRGAYQQAEVTIKPLLEKLPPPREALHLAGQLRYIQGDALEAARIYRYLISMEPRDHFAHCNLGECYERLGRLDQAETEYKAALAAQPEYNRARIKLAELRAGAASAPSPASRPMPSMTSNSGTRITSVSGERKPFTPGDEGPKLFVGRRSLLSYLPRLLVALTLGVVGLGLLRIATDAAIVNLFTAGLQDEQQRLLDRADVLARNNAPSQVIEATTANADAAGRALDQAQQAVQNSFTIVGDVVLVAAAVTLISVVLSYASTMYVVYEYRVETTSGVLRRVTKSLWTYQIKRVDIEVPWLLALVGQSQLRIYADDGTGLLVKGFGSQTFMEKLAKRIRAAASTDRRYMKNYLS